MKTILKILLLLIFVGIVGEITHEAVFFFSPLSSNSDPHVVLVEPGSFLRNAELLEKEGVIEQPHRFARIVRVLGLQGRVKVGEYEVRSSMSPYQLLKVLMSGKSILHPVHIPEGFNLDQVADELASKNLVNREEFLKLARSGRMAKYFQINEDSLEGYLYPDTYSFTRFTGDHVILRTMVEKFKDVYNREVKSKADERNMSMHDVVTLASIIEKETGAPEERPIISSVFHNRLDQGMKLQSDPTVIYGKKGDKKNITRVDLITPSPYNTYTLKGLPVGPISNPGKGSLLAAVLPSETKYLYFVSQNNGTHVFTTNYKDHQKAVAKFQLDPSAREGHSWREHLKKNPTQASGTSSTSAH